MYLWFGISAKLIHKKEMGEFFNVHELYEKSTIQTLSNIRYGYRLPIFSLYLGNDVKCEFIFKTTYLYEAEVDSPGLLTAVAHLKSNVNF